MTRGCPDANALSELVEGNAGRERRQQLHAHIDGCPTCTRLLVELGYLTDARAAEGEAPTPRIGRYHIGDVLGRGGMGTVYLAFDPDLDRHIALKVLDQADARTQDRLLHEARAMARLSHPNVVQVHEVGTFDGGWFVAMERIHGGTLGSWADGRPWRQRLTACIEAGQGLAAAHDAGLVHRDFKPANVLCGSDGRARVTDFGLVTTGERPTATEGASLGRGDGLTLTGTVLGTPAYMAPEQHEASRADARSDQFAFCVTVWQVLSGQHPFVEVSEGGAVLRHKTAALPPWPAAAPKLPREVMTALRRGLSASPDDRWPSMNALLTPLRRGLAPRRWPWLLVPFAVLAAWASWQGYRGYLETKREAACAARGASIDAVWNDEVRQRVEQGIAATGVPFAAAMVPKLGQWLDRRAELWREQATTACVNATVHKTWPSATADRAMWCLDEQRVEFEMLVDRFANASTTTAVTAVQAASSPSSASWCTDELMLRAMPDPPQGKARQAAARVRRSLVRADTSLQTADTEEGLRHAAAAAGQAVAEDLPVLHAGALALEAALHYQRGDFEGATAAARRSYMLAASIGAWDTAARSATQLLRVIAQARGSLEEGVVWAELAEVGIAHAGDPIRMRRARLLRAFASLHVNNGEIEIGLQEAEEALALTQSALGPEHPKTAIALTVLGALHSAAGDLPAAEHYYRDALQRQRAALGEGHPAVGDTLTNLAGAMLNQGRVVEARDAAEQGVAILERQYAALHPRIAIALTNYGIALSQTGEREKGKTMLERALAEFELRLGPDHPEVAQAMMTLGVWHQTGGNLEQARTLFEPALAIAEARGLDRLAGEILTNIAAVYISAANYREAATWFERASVALASATHDAHPILLSPLTGQGSALIELGEGARAVEVLERALRVGDVPSASIAGLSNTRFELARALWLVGEQQRGRALARMAIEDLRRAGEPWARDLARAEAWLGKHEAGD